MLRLKKIHTALKVFSENIYMDFFLLSSGHIHLKKKSCSKVSMCVAAGQDSVKTGWSSVGRPDVKGASRWQWTLYCWGRMKGGPCHLTPHKKTGETDHHDDPLRKTTICLQKWTKGRRIRYMIRYVYLSFVFDGLLIQGILLFTHLLCKPFWIKGCEVLTITSQFTLTRTDVLLPPSEDLAKVHGG